MKIKLLEAFLSGGKEENSLPMAQNAGIPAADRNLDCWEGKFPKKGFVWNLGNTQYLYLGSLMIIFMACSQEALDGTRCGKQEIMD